MSDYNEMCSEIERKIFQGFAVGDEIYFLRGEWKYDNCLTCDGKGRVKAVINGKEEVVNCPHCKKNSRNAKWIYVIHRGRIIQAEFRIWLNGSDKCVEPSFHVEDYHNAFYPNEIWNPDTELSINDIFLTKEEAQKECDRKNKKEE